jgi:NADPH-dependent 2,4-dienoyl-CoA reductase/sulfur reductase-like enzyme
MPYYVSGLIHKSDQLLALSPEEAINKRGIDLKVRHEVTHVDRSGKRVTVRDLITGKIFDQEYEPGPGP